MSISKSDAIKQLGNNSQVSNQASLVRKLAGPQINKPLKMVVPGGKNLTELVSRENLSEAVFTWLRRCRHFKDVLVSLAEDPYARKHTVTTVVDFETRGTQPQWEVEGKKWLAERVAEVLNMDNVLAVKVEKQGISAILDNDQSFNPSSEDWSPNLVFTPHKPTGL